jgi:O-antigen/teichoic acid export membrane protein
MLKLKIEKIGTTKLNVISNYISQIINSVIGLVAIPIYIHYLGTETFGLIGVFATLQGLLTILDLGITPTLSREMALYSTGTSSEKYIKNLFKTLEIFVFFILIIIVFTTFVTSNYLSINFVTSQTLSLNQISNALKIMGFVAALKFYESLYKSALIGLEKQLLYNVIFISFFLIRTFGAILILAFYSNNLYDFFIWQALVSIINIIVFRWVTLNSFNDRKVKGKYDFNTIKTIWKFAAGMATSTILSLILTQFDKLVLIKFLSLTDFSYYYIASTIGGALLMLINPITQAYHPKLTKFHASDDENKLIETFHEGAQLINLFFGTACIVVIFYAKDLLLIWTHKPEISEKSFLILVLLVFGYLLNGLGWMNYHLQQAIGWTSLIIKNNFIAILFYIPAVYFFVPKYGALGAAFIWIFLNLYYLVISSSLMFKKIIIKEKYIWLIKDLIFPLIASTFTILILKYLIPSSNNIYLKIFTIFLVSVFGLVASFSSSNILTKKFNLKKYLL